MQQQEACALLCTHRALTLRHSGARGSQVDASGLRVPLEGAWTFSVGSQESSRFGMGYAEATIQARLF